MAASLACASIEGSKHDFRSQDSLSSGSGDSNELCAFCHTPVGGESSPDDPQWVQQQAGEEYSRPASYGTVDLEANVVGTVSVTCLSCHDGTQAADSSYTTNTLANGDNGQVLSSGAARTEFSSAPMVDVLAGHPVHISYAGGACAGIERDCDPAVMPGRGKDFRVARFDVINSVKSWWVDTPDGAPGMRDKSDMILYPRDYDGAIGPAVECGSCHDPHDARPRPVSFLRMPGDDSSICLTCHIK